MTGAGSEILFVSRRTLGKAVLGSAATLLPAADASAAAQNTPIADNPAGGIVLGPGIHQVAANITMKADVTVLPGGRIFIAADRTLTILGDFQAPIGPVFVGPGKVILGKGRTPAAYPEWWGAVPNDSSVDCLPALRACLAAHRIMLLGGGDYFISDTLVVERAYIRIWGAGYRSNGSNQGSRLVLSGTGDVMHVGTVKKPPSVNGFPQGIDIRWIELARTGPIDPLATGMRVSFVLFSHFESISAREHTTGFAISGAVRTYFRNCLAFRSFEGSGTGPHVFRGFDLDGQREIGLAGGNASVYLIDCNATIGGRPKLSEAVGMLLQGAVADSYIINFETSEVPVGIRIEGMAASLGAGRRRSGHADVHIQMPIIDQCATSGIEIKDTSDHCLIDIQDPYVALAPGALAAIFLSSVHGLSTITGGQLIGWVDADAGGNGIGFYALDSEGFEVAGTKLLGLRRPVTLVGCHDFVASIAINNPDQPGSQGAAWLRSCLRGTLNVRVKGRPGAFPQGIYLDGHENEAILIEATGLDSGAIKGGALNRVVADDRPLAVPGRYGSIEVRGTSS